ncbi:nitronate monooxygenase, partial [Streptomyces sp. SID5998]|nr:nitronate monooxygenase [Streptomyces sp. SID5998]
MSSALSALTDLFPIPIVQAPMAGGPSGPQLAAAVTEAGGLGFLAAGYKTADGMYQEIKQVRGLTGGPFGVNVFMPQPDHAESGAVDLYAQQLAGEAVWYQTELGEPDHGSDDGYEIKIAALVDDPVPVVSFHFGVPTREVIDSLHRVGTFTLVTATTVEEALAVERAGADAVIAQGIEAGGHQGTHRDQPENDCAALGVLSLVAQVREAVGLPV